MLFCHCSTKKHKPAHSGKAKHSSTQQHTTAHSHGTEQGEDSDGSQKQRIKEGWRCVCVVCCVLCGLCYVCLLCWCAIVPLQIQVHNNTQQPPHTTQSQVLTAMAAKSTAMKKVCNVCVGSVLCGVFYVCLIVVLVCCCVLLCRCVLFCCVWLCHCVLIQLCQQHT